MRFESKSTVARLVFDGGEGVSCRVDSADEDVVLEELKSVLSHREIGQPTAPISRGGGADPHREEELVADLSHRESRRSRGPV